MSMEDSMSLRRWRKVRRFLRKGTLAWSTRAFIMCDEITFVAATSEKAGRLKRHRFSLHAHGKSAAAWFPAGERPRNMTGNSKELA